MALLIKVKVINKVKGQFDQQINPNWPKWTTKQSGEYNIIQVSKLFFTVAQLNGQYVNVILGNMTVSCDIPQFN